MRLRDVQDALGRSQVDLGLLLFVRLAVLLQVSEGVLVIGRRQQPVGQGPACPLQRVQAQGFLRRELAFPQPFRRRALVVGWGEERKEGMEEKKKDPFHRRALA